MNSAVLNKFEENNQKLEEKNCAMLNKLEETNQRLEEKMLNKLDETTTEIRTRMVKNMEIIHEQLKTIHERKNVGIGMNIINGNVGKDAENDNVYEGNGIKEIVDMRKIIKRENV
ncbi:hypothetical protein FQA39_LY06072 [Lamprigera yunnana]|nr:hypothetical protein FQA39_LY06072 [Lamprigera yunnana]